MNSHYPEREAELVELRNPGMRGVPSAISCVNLANDIIFKGMEGVIQHRNTHSTYFLLQPGLHFGFRILVKYR